MHAWNTNLWPYTGGAWIHHCTYILYTKNEHSSCFCYEIIIFQYDSHILSCCKIPSTILNMKKTINVDSLNSGIQYDRLKTFVLLQIRNLLKLIFKNFDSKKNLMEVGLLDQSWKNWFYFSFIKIQYLCITYSIGYSQI